MRAVQRGFRLLRARFPGLGRHDRRSIMGGWMQQNERPIGRITGYYILWVDLPVCE